MCEILLDYVTVECDWLWWPDDITAIWKAASEKEACTAPEAGLMALSLAYAALLMGASDIYKITVPPELHQELFKLAQEYAVGEGLKELDLLAGMVMYIIYSGRIDEAYGYVEGCLRMAVKLNLFDESLPAWRGLSWEDSEQRRRVAWNVIVQSRWAYLGVASSPLPQLPQTVSQPQWNSYATEAIRLTDHSNPLRLFRVKSKAESDRTRVVKTLMVEYTSIFPRLHTYLHCGNQSPEECQSIYREIVHNRDVRLPAAGFEDPATSAVDFSDPISSRDAAQRIIMHHSFGHILFVTLRHWLTNTSNDPLVQTLREASVDGAMRTVATVPLMKAFATSEQGPFIAPFAASNLFSAAMIFAVPILRAVKNAEGELEGFHEWPPVPKSLDTNKTRAPRTPLPPSAFKDPTMRYCANNIVLLLDAISVLKNSPLREFVEEKVSALIDKYGLRQGAMYEQPRATPSAVAPPSIEWLDPFPWPSGEPEQDVFQQLLQMDTAIWQAWLGGGDG